MSLGKKMKLFFLLETGATYLSINSSTKIVLKNYCHPYSYGLEGKKSTLKFLGENQQMKNSNMSYDSKCCEKFKCNYILSNYFSNFNNFPEIWHCL